MTQESKLVALAQAIGTDIKTLTNNQGSLPALDTTSKNSLVDAINELKTLIGAASGVIDDTATDASHAWSASKITAMLDAAKAAVKDDLVDGAGTALDTLKELADALGNDPNFAATLAADVANRVRYDSAQTLTPTQQTQARTNIAAYGADEIGDYDHNFVADYVAAKS